MNFFAKSLAIIAISLNITTLAAAQNDIPPIDTIFFKGFNDSSKFVQIPVDIGSFVGAVVGAVPTALVAGGFHFANANPAYVKTAASTTLTVFARSFGLLFGLPFKTVKLILWDSPEYIYGGITGASDPPAPVS